MALSDGLIKLGVIQACLESSTYKSNSHQWKSTAALMSKEVLKGHC